MMATVTLSRKQVRNLQQPATERTAELAWESGATFSHSGEAWTYTSPDGEVQEGWYKGLRTRPFLDKWAGRYYGRSMKFSENTLAEIRPWVENADVAWVRDDGVTALVVEHGLPITVQADYGKTDKRLSRLFGQMPFYGHLNRGDVRLAEFDVGPATRKAFDGAGFRMSHGTAKAIYEGALAAVPENSVSDKEAESAKAKLSRMWGKIEDEVRKGHNVPVYVTGLAREGEIKGHGTIVPDDKLNGPGGNRVDMLVLTGEWKPEVRFDEAHADELYIAFSPVKGSDLVVDVQNFTMHYGDGFWDWLMPAVERYFEDKIDRLLDGDYLYGLDMALSGIDESDLERVTKWPVMGYIASGGNPHWFMKTVREAASSIWQKLRSNYGSQRFPVYDGRRLYVYTEAVMGVRVERGDVRVFDNFIVVNNVDWVTASPQFQNLHELNAWISAGGEASELEPGIADTLGGCDQDDLVLWLYGVITRSPTMVGEAWVFENYTGPNPWGIDTSKLPSRPVAEYWPEDDLPTGPTVEGRTPENTLTVCAALSENGGAVGIAAKALRYYVTAFGRLPENLPCNMEGIIDRTTKELADMSEITDWFRNLVEWIAEQSLAPDGVKIPKELANELAATLDHRNFEVDTSGEHWYDKTMESYRGKRDLIAKQIQGLADAAQPPMAELSIFAGWDPAASAYRALYGRLYREVKDSLGDVPEMQHHGSLLDAADAELARGEREEAFTYLREGCEEFLARYAEEDRPNILGAVLYRTYLKRADGQGGSDASAWQRGAIREYTMEALRRAGIIGLPVFEDGELVVQVEDSPEVETVCVPLYYAWAWLQGRKVPEAYSKAERETLQANEQYGDVLVNTEISFSDLAITQKGKRVTRTIAKLEDLMIGQLPATFDRKGAVGLRVFSATPNDGALFLVGELVYEHQIFTDEQPPLDATPVPAANPFVL
jgi:hypothetical protein